MKQEAQNALNNIKQFIDIENKFIQKEHELYDSLDSIKMLYSHALDVSPENFDKTSKTNREIEEKLNEIIVFIQDDRLKNLNFEKEEELLLKQLEIDIKNKDWKLVKRDITVQEDDESNVLRLEIDDVEKLQLLFKELKELMQGSALMPQAKEEKEHEHYFFKVYRIVSAYEKIFLELFEKEQEILDKLDAQNIN
jgi:hypothetical protein